MADLAVLVLTLNEEKNIDRCLKSVKSIAKQIIVIDSGSTDKTVELAKENGATVWVNKPFMDHATQFNWAIENTNIISKWILRLDADETITPELAKEINDELLIHDNDDINGFELKCRVIFMGKWIKHGGTYPLILTRLFRKGYGKVEMRKMDEHTLITGKTLRLNNDIMHHDFKGLQKWTQKHNVYSVKECEEYYKRKNENKNQLEGDIFGAQRQRKRFLKNGVYYNLPKFTRAKLYYIYRYFIKLGFLDGVEGKIYYFLQSYWYRFLVDAKIYENEINENNKG